MKTLAFALGLGTLLAPFAVAAHGTMELPISRVYACYKEGPENPKSAACKEAKSIGGTQPFYDWNEVNQGAANGQHQMLIKDGTLCAGGRDKYRGFNQPRSDWTTSAIVPDAAGNFTFVFYATAPHAVKSFDLYVTRAGWNPASPLNWADLEKFASVGNPVRDGQRYRMTVPLPAGRTGQHVIYAIWQRADSPEAFYACSDVRFSDDPSPPPPAVTWEEVSQVTAQTDLPAGSTAKLRVFDPNGGDAAAYSVGLTAETGRAVNWPAALAAAVNAASPVFRIGVMSTAGGTTTIAPVQSATGNRVYRNQAYPGYTYNIDVDIPGPVTQPGAADWREGVAYALGQVVTYQGRSYKCLQPHTAWIGANWTPASSPALWQAV